MQMIHRTDDESKFHNHIYTHIIRMVMAIGAFAFYYELPGEGHCKTAETPHRSRASCTPETCHLSLCFFPLL